MPGQVIPSRRGYSLKTRLYAVIGFLACLPACGVAVALIALHAAVTDSAALDRTVTAMARKSSEAPRSSSRRSGDD